MSECDVMVITMWQNDVEANPSQPNILLQNCIGTM